MFVTGIVFGKENIFHLYNFNAAYRFATHENECLLLTIQKHGQDMNHQTAMMTLMGLDISVYLIGLAIAIPTFFALRWILKKVTKADTLTRNRLTWAGTIILTPIIYVGLVIISMFYMSYYPTRDFNEATWHADKEKRYEMTADLIESEMLIGKTKDEVEKILGNDFYRYDKDHWVYDVGFVPGLMNIDPDFLHVYFKDKRVEKVYQRQT
jgi:amino acid transporter